jgi:DNA end-binding protein Ku
MRAMKKASLVVAIMNVPVAMYKATDDHDPGFHQHHAGKCQGRIGQRRYCKTCEQTVEYADIIRGTEYEDTVVILSNEQLDALKAERMDGDLFEVDKFVPLSEVDPIYFEAPYFLVPESKGAKGYALLRHVLNETGRAAIVKYVQSTKEHVGCVTVGLNNVLILHQLRWADEVREADFPVLNTMLSLTEDAEMLHLTRQLVDGMTDTFDPHVYEDTYTTRVKELVAATAAGKADNFEYTTPVEYEKVDDLLAQLRKSVDAKGTKPARKSKAVDLDASMERHPAGKKVAKKAPAKAPAKRAPRKAS